MDYSILFIISHSFANNTIGPFYRDI